MLKEWNNRPDTSGDADLAKLLASGEINEEGKADTSGDAELARRLAEDAMQLEETLNKRPDTSQDDTLARSIALGIADIPDTSQDEVIARAIAKIFEESISPANSPLDSIFVEKSDTPRRFCEICHTPKSINRNMRLGSIKEEKFSEDDANHIIVLLDYLGSTEMRIKRIGDQVSSQHMFDPSQVEVIGSPCSLCSSFIGTTDISLAICSVVRRANVSGRKAVNFDLTKSFVDVVTWLSTSVHTGTLPLKILYHWTKPDNFESILDKNLVVPGNHGVEVVNGSALGVGIYASNSFTYGQTYGVGAREAIMVLGLLAPNDKPLGKDRSMETYSNYRVSLSRYCFFKSELVLPLFLTSNENRFEQEKVAKIIIELLNKVRPISFEKAE